MAFLSPSVARKRSRIEQQVYNRKRARVQSVTKKGQGHAQKVTHRPNVPAPKGEFIHYGVEYVIPRSDDYNSLLCTLTKAQLEKYMQYLKSRSVQTYYGPLLQLLMQHKDNHGIFNTPVNPEVQNLPTYYEIVEHPMDLGTVRDNLMCGRYQQPRDLIADIRLVFQNAKKFNPETHFVNQCATQMLKTLDAELEKVRNRYEQNRLSQYNHTCNSCRGYPCLICGDKCLKYSPPVYVCDGDCRERILRNTTYYIIRGKKGRYCPKCYAKKVVGMDKTERKNLFVRKKNDEVFPESWVQCSRCREWMHCVCGLVHPREVTSNYVCPVCLAEDPHRIPKPVQGSMAIPRCDLSDFLTERIHRCVEEEVAKQPCRMRVSGAELRRLKESLVVRVVSNIASSVVVKRQLAPMFTSNYDEMLSIPYQSKCVAFFQHRDGVDILLFVLYVHEFGDDVTPANRRCIYISYLDSVHFLSPRYLRTPVYHQILNGYLEYAKMNGHCRAHIWACPPSRGDDYIFSHHPRDQRTPNADHLISWYRSLLAKGMDAGVVSHVTCQLDQLLHMNAVWSNSPETNQRQIRCFSMRGTAEEVLPEVVLERVQSTASTVTQEPLSSDYESENDNPSESELSSDTSTVSTVSTVSTAPTPVTPAEASPRTAARIVPGGALSDLERALLSTLPYFEGDYLPYVGEDLLKEIYQESLKPKPTRSTSSHLTSSTSSKSKAELRERLLQENIQQLPSEFLRKYAKSMLENPSRFMIVYLRPYCSRCGEVIIGEGKRCDECFQTRTPFFLCGRCMKRNIFHAHSLRTIQMPALPPLRDENPLISYPFLDKRHEFLRLCQGNFLQFDTLRQSILSTSLVLEFMFHKVPDPFLDMCDACERVLFDEYYACRHNDDYRLCKECLNKDGGIHAKEHQGSEE